MKPRPTAAPVYPFSLPVGERGTFQVNREVPPYDRQQTASCLLDTADSLAQLLACKSDDLDQVDFQHVGWSIAYLVSMARGLVNSFEFEVTT